LKIRRIKSGHGQAGYVLLALMLAVTLILIALSMEAPRIAQQIKRDREEELLHRGKDYATAIKRFVHKNGGRYPVSVEQLENTNHIRFLRKRYKDPITGEGEWRLVHFGEAEIKIPAPNPNQSGSTGTLQTNNNPGNTPSTPPPNSGGGGGTIGAGGGGGGGTYGGTGNTLGTLKTSDIGNGQPIGGGQIIGVASTSKKESIKEFNEKDHYNDWFFVYDLRLEQAGGTGVTVAAPRIGGSAKDATATGQQPQGSGNTLGNTPGNPPPPGGPPPAPSPTPQ